MNENLFRKTSIDKVTSPERLDDYIRVTSPSVWMVLAAIVILLAALLVWAVLGTLPTTVSVAGIARDGVVSAYVSADAGAEIQAGMAAKAGEVTGRVLDVGSTPLSQGEVSQALGSDYLVHALGISAWNVPVTLSMEGVPDGIVQVSITTSSVKPIYFILN